MHEDRPRTPEETEFLELLSGHLSWKPDVWPHLTADGQSWLCVSHDFVEANVIRDTLRLDFEGNHIRGGWSPAALNWDDGVKALDAGVDCSPPDGIDANGSPTELATVAAAWFQRHVDAWPQSERRRRWHKSTVAQPPRTKSGWYWSAPVLWGRRLAWLVILGMGSWIFVRGLTQLAGPDQWITIIGVLAGLSAATMSAMQLWVSTESFDRWVLRRQAAARPRR